MLDAFFEAHEELLTDAGRTVPWRSSPLTTRTRKPTTFGTFTRCYSDSDGDRDFGIMADVDLDATQDGDGIVFANYRAGVIEDIAG